MQTPLFSCWEVVICLRVAHHGRAEDEDVGWEESIQL